MALLSNTNIKSFADKLAAVVQELDTDLGSGSEASTPSKTAADLLGSVTALTDADQLADLLDGALNTASLAKAQANYGMVEPLLAAIDRHVGGLSEYAVAQDLRVHYALRKVAPSLNGLAYFPPETLIATYAVVSAAGQSGTLTPGTAIDTTKYGKANFIVKVINQAIGVTDLVLTLTLKKQDGTTEQKVVTVTGSSTVGTTFDVGTHDTDMYVDCTAVTFTGGNDGDDVEIRSELERSISL